MLVSLVGYLHCQFVLGQLLVSPGHPYILIFIHAKTTAILSQLVIKNSATMLLSVLILTVYSGDWNRNLCISEVLLFLVPSTTYGVTLDT